MELDRAGTMERGRLRLKGFAEPVQVFEVVWQEQEPASDKTETSPA